MFPEKTRFLKRSKNASALLSSTCVFKYLKIMKIIHIPQQPVRLLDGRLAQRLSPRREGSHWTELNRQRCQDLERRGLMTDAGRKAY